MMHPKTFLLLISVVLLTVSPVDSRAEDEKPGLHRFYVLFAEVDLLKEPDETQFNKLMAFATASPKAAYSLAEFWWSWGLRDCWPYLSQEIQRASKLPKKEADEEMKRIEKERDSCVKSFIFTHWDDINASMNNKAINFPKDNEPVKP